jgi:diguanylate cyclase (GGDEF)-like protein/PAS domain S-box-containing protein
LKDLQDLYDHAPCGYHSLDANGRYLQINDVALSWLECPREAVIGLLRPVDFFSAESKANFTEAFPRFRAEGRIGPIEFDLIGRRGTRRRVTVSASAVKDEHGNLQKSRSVMYDISELHEARQRLEHLNREQLAMLDNELVGIVKMRNRCAVWKNRALESIFGYQPGELDDQPARVLYRDDESYRAVGEAAYPVLARGESFRTQALMARKGGEPIWIDMSGVQLSKETGESMWLMIDITQMKQHQAQVERMALHDPLTGLANRLSLSNLLHQTILRCEHGRGFFAVCFVDLNEFKPINDQFGHDVGDLVLKTVANRLREVVRGADTVARLGGDEFVLVLTSLLSIEHHQIIVDRVIAAIEQPIKTSDDRSVQVSASIGTAFYPEDGTQPETLLLRADQAMYKAKRDAQESIRKQAAR